MSSIINPGGASSGSSGPTQAFRGLHLRTHPDADQAAAKVMLVHADEIVFSDGTRVTSGLDRLVADITASGAGGLDTGSEAASTWYEAHAIRKSSDGTLALMLHRAKSYALDQQSTTTNTAYSLRRATAPTRTKLTQSVVPALSGTVPFVDLQLNRDNAVSGRIWVTLEADAAGSPSGTPLATSDKLEAGNIADANQWLRFVFRTPAAVVASTTYWLVLQADYTASDTVVIAWQVDSSNPYAAGAFKSFDSGAWVAVASTDATFKLYVTQNDLSVTLPSGYDQSCKVGYAQNAASSNLKSFVAIDRSIDYQSGAGDANNVASVTNIFPTLVDLSLWLPPVPAAALVIGRNAAALGSVWLSGVPDFAAATGMLRVLHSVSADQMSHAAVKTDTQAFYVHTNSAAASLVWMLGYEWGG